MTVWDARLEVAVESGSEFDSEAAVRETLEQAEYHDSVSMVRVKSVVAAGSLPEGQDPPRPQRFLQVSVETHRLWEDGEDEGSRHQLEIREFDSSIVREAAFSDTLQALFVRYRTGPWYRHSEFTAEEWRELLAAESVGGWVSAHVRGKKPFEKLG